MLVTAILKYKPVTALINETNAMIGSTRLLDLPRYQTARLTVTLQDKKKSRSTAVFTPKGNQVLTSTAVQRGSGFGTTRQTRQTRQTISIDAKHGLAVYFQNAILKRKSLSILCDLPLVPRGDDCETVNHVSPCVHTRSYCIYQPWMVIK